uniref:Formylglycine-generating enzyme, required for sulfatase activity, contains SUMF1/FGE domain n=1 Tax=Candidatus Kentrum sp. MB TaxID=2138164 RepID=A0A450XVX8_9GAMM|nr:MAG: Formylglycine-generating enzyme, required for sulfatase activity, contains SUMF1/FGE domain [Candidatus Kentron sp. MB]
MNRMNKKKFVLEIMVALAILGVAWCFIWCKDGAPPPPAAQASTAVWEPQGVGALRFSHNAGDEDGRLVVNANISEGTLYIDGKPVGSTGNASYTLPPGRYGVQVEKTGYEPFKTHLTVAAAEKHVVHAVLTPKRQEKRHSGVRKRVAELAVNANISDAIVYIDNEPIGIVGSAFHPIPAGTRKVRMERDGYQPFETEITLTARERHTLDVYLNPLPTLIVCSDTSQYTVYVDGKRATPVNVGRARLSQSCATERSSSAYALSVGEHQIQVKKPNHRFFETGVTLRGGQHEIIAVRFTPLLSSDTGISQKPRGRQIDARCQRLKEEKEPGMVVIWPVRDRIDAPESKSKNQSDEQSDKQADEQSNKQSDEQVDQGAREHIPALKPFALGATEVTFDDYDRFACLTGRRLPSDEGWGRGQRPVINVNWNDAMAYARWLNKRTGKGYRLPAEAEWEYAARAGTRTRYSWGDEEASACVYTNGYDISAKKVRNLPSTHLPCDDGQPNTARVGRYTANGFGLFDMYGNVREWTADCWRDEYPTSFPEVGTEKDDKGCLWRVVRGGAWHSEATDLQPTYRSKSSAHRTLNSIGFRLARDL